MVMFHLDEESRDEETLGRYLERKRNERGVSLREVSNETRIGLSFLESIDRGEFHKLPGVAYARGFVRAYAVSVGLDPDEMEERLKAEMGQKTS